MAKNRPRAPMPNSERAKQFMPFSALRGLSAALAQKEKIYIPKREVSEEIADEIDRLMRTLNEGVLVDVMYYKNGEYLHVGGEVEIFSKVSRILQVSGVKIPFDDIYRISTERLCD